MKEIINGIEIELTTEEIAKREADLQNFKDSEYDRLMLSLRNKRNLLLQETDYLSLSDTTLSDNMKTYRQELRDITNGIDTVAKAKTKLETDDNGNLKNFPTKP
tara:strand:+ start:856 stop:1167 length:312 start_codon:yes stop_codon:yes gene_type:complete